MKTVFNTAIPNDIEDIDLTYYEKWIALESTLPPQIITSYIDSKFPNKYYFNDHVKPFFKSSNLTIEHFLDDSLLFFYEEFMEIINSSDIEKYLNTVKNEPHLDMSSIVWPFTYYCSIKLNDKYPDMFRLQKKSVINSLTYIVQNLTTYALKMHILDMNEHPNYEKYSKNDSYTDFLKDTVLIKKFIKTFYLENPLFFTRCLIRTNNLLNYVFEVLDNLSEKFNIDTITCLEYGEGDAHSGAKTVVKFTINNNEHWFYKPKNLKIEKFFYSFINHFNLDYNSKYFKNNIYEDTYGIVKEVDYISVKTESEAVEYYFNLGKLQFILYILGGNDIHYENIISNGNIPHIIDLETLFQINYDTISYDSIEFEKQIKNQLELLQSIGILNMTLPGLDDKYNISALSGQGKKNVAKKEIFVNPNSMSLYVGHSYIDNFDKKNIPFDKNGNKINYFYYRKDIVRGFEEAISLFNLNKDKIIKHIFNLPNTLEVRNVLRPTASYVDFIFYSTHPIYMLNPAKYNKLLENLLGMPFKNEKINYSEINDIDQGDIPIFFSHIGEKNIYDSRHNNLGSYWSKSPKDKTLSRINSIDGKKADELLVNLKIQLDLLEISENSTSTEKFSMIESIHLLEQKFDKEGIFFNTVSISEKFILDYTTIGYGLCNGVTGLWFFLKTTCNKCDLSKKLLKKIENQLDNIELSLITITENFLYDIGSLVFYFYVKSHNLSDKVNTEKFLYLAKKFDMSFLKSLFPKINFDNISNEHDLIQVQKINLYEYDLNYFPTESPVTIFYYCLKNNMFENSDISLRKVCNI